MMLFLLSLPAGASDGEIIVARVDRVGAAQSVGLLAGDRLLGWRHAQQPDWQPLSGATQLWQLELDAGDYQAVTLRLERQGQPRTVALQGRDWRLALRCTRRKQVIDRPCLAQRELRTALRLGAAEQIESAWQAIAARDDRPLANLILWKTLNELDVDSLTRAPVRDWLAEQALPALDADLPVGAIALAHYTLNLASTAEAERAAILARLQPWLERESAPPEVVLAVINAQLKFVDADVADALRARASELCEQRQWADRRCLETLIALGERAIGEDDFEGARQHCGRAVELAGSVPRWQSARAVALICQSSNHLYLGDFASAEGYARQARELAAAHHLGLTRRAQANNQLGLVQEQQGNRDQAVIAYAEALSILGDTDPENSARIMVNRANALWGLQRLDEAKSQYERAIATTGDPQTRLGAQIGFQVLLIEAKDWATADALSAQLLERARADFPSSRIHAVVAANSAEVARELGELEREHALLREALEVLQQMGANNWRVASRYHELAQNLYARGQFEAALQHARQAVAVIDQQIAQLGGDELTRINFRDQFERIYRNWIALLLEAEQVQQAAAASRRYRWQEMRRLAARRGQPAQPQSPPDLASNQALLSYLQLGQRSVVFVSTGSGASRHTEVVDLPGESGELAEAARRWRTQLAFAPDPAQVETEVAAARRVYDLVFAPLEAHLSGVDELILQLDGPLRSIPFAALVDRAGSEGNRPARLLDRFLLRESFAALPAEHFQVSLDSVVGIAAGATDAARSAGWAPLRGAQRELRMLSGRFGSRARLIDQEQASEAALRRVLQQPKLLHIAAHAVADPVQPLQSYVVLNPPPSIDKNDAGHHDTADDGKLHAEEVLALDLRGTAVVVAGCETALGRDSRSDGLLGLRYAFHGAGAPVVVASLWRVADQATADLFQHYYAHLLDHRRADLALRQAQLAMLDQPGPHAHPYYWAGLVVSEL